MWKPRTARTAVKPSFGLIAILLAGLAVALAFPVWHQEAEAAQITLTLVAQTGYEDLIPEFERLNPDIKINYVAVSGGSKEVQERVTIMAAAGVAFDVFWVHSYSFGDLLKANLILPLNDFISRDKQFNVNAYLKPTIREFSRGETIYALPRETSSLVVYYNRGLFDQVGLQRPSSDWTFEQMLQIARKLTTSQSKQRWGIHLPYRHITMLPFIWGFGGDIVSADRTQAIFDSKETAKALQWIVDLKSREKVASIDQDISSYGNLQNAFAAGSVGMFLDTPYMTASLPQNIEWDIAHLPVGPEGRYTRIASSAHAISKTTKHPEQSWRLLCFLSGEPGQRALAMEHGLMPALSSLASDWILSNSARNPANKIVFVEAFAYGRPEPITSNWQKFIDVETARLAPVWKGDKPVSAVVGELSKELTSVIRQ